MGISGVCPYGFIEDKDTVKEIESQGTNRNEITIEKFINLIPKNIFNKMNSEIKDLKNYINNAEVKTVKIPDNLINNDNSQKEIYYHGEFNEKGEKNGIGKMIIINENNEKIFYCGIWENDKLNEGKIFYMDNEEYTGQINNYLRDGQGEYISENETYKGSWKNDQKDGDGLVKHKDGYEYNGKFKNNKFNGKGTLNWKDGSYYVGEFKDNFFNGMGYLEGSNKHIYSGYFKNGAFNGKGEFKWIDRLDEEKYKGSYSNGKKDGEGIFYFKNGDIFKGNWECGKPHGEGVYETKNRKYFGNWRQGMFMQITEVEDKEGAEEEHFNLNFKTPDEDINFLEHISNSLISNTIKSTILASIEIIK